MQKKLTLTIDEDLVRPHVVKRDLYAAYRAMSADRVRESEAIAWAEATSGDVNG